MSFSDRRRVRLGQQSRLNASMRTVGTSRRMGVLVVALAALASLAAPSRATAVNPPAYVALTVVAGEAGVRSHDQIFGSGAVRFNGRVEECATGDPHGDATTCVYEDSQWVRGTTLVLEAVPDPGSRFSASGPCEWYGTWCVLTLGPDQNDIVITFEPNFVDMDVQCVVNAWDDTGNCNSHVEMKSRLVTYQADAYVFDKYTESTVGRFNRGARVTFTPKPGEGATFLGWATSPCGVGIDSCTGIIDGGSRYRALFSLGCGPDSCLARIPVHLSETEQARLSVLARHFATSPTQLLHDSVSLLAFILGFDPGRTPTPVVLPPPADSAIPLVASWEPNGRGALNTVKTQYALGDEDAHRLSLLLLSYLASLQGI